MSHKHFPEHLDTLETLMEDLPSILSGDETICYWFGKDVDSCLKVDDKDILMLHGKNGKMYQITVKELK